MAKFTLTIETDGEGELYDLVSRLMNPGALPLTPAEQAAPAKPRAARTGKQTSTKEVEPADAPIEEEISEKTQTAAVEEPAEDEEEIDLDAVKKAGSAAMPKLRAAGLTKILNEHANGATTFGTIDPQHYRAVYAALKAAA